MPQNYQLLSLNLLVILCLVLSLKFVDQDTTSCLEHAVINPFVCDVFIVVPRVVRELLGPVIFQCIG